MTQTYNIISIVTPVFNMVDHVEDTVRSVLFNARQNLEYIVVDGGSTDGSLDHIYKYKPQISTIVSEPDNGQYNAINKGFSLSTGNIMAWLNADDILMPWTLSLVEEIFNRFPGVQWITGLPSYINRAGQISRIDSHPAAYPREAISNGWYRKDIYGYLQQESMFWRRSLWDRAGGLDERFSLAADFDLWVKFAAHAELVAVDAPLAAFRERPGSQRSSAMADRYEGEVAAICSEMPSPTIKQFISSKSQTARALIRVLSRKSGTVIRFDRNREQWVLLERSRAISRVQISTLLDEWFCARRAGSGETY